MVLAGNQPTPPQQRLVTDAVLTQARGLTAGPTPVTVYDGEIPVTVPLLGQVWSTTDPTAAGATITGVADPSGRIAPYVTLYPPAMAPTRERSLRPVYADGTGVYRLNLAAAFRRDVEALLDRVTALMYGWAPTIPGYSFGPMAPPFGWVGVPIIRETNTDPAPTRFSTQMQLALTYTR